MIYQLIRLVWISFVFKFNQACLKQSNELNYLFMNDHSQIRIPLLPRDCLDCQSAYQVDIQLLDEQFHTNRTIQRIKIFLKNFEIEDSSYICLTNLCPIVAEHGSDTIILNITSSLFSHLILSMVYLNHFNSCSIQTRFAILAINQLFTCTEEIYLHPRLNIPIVGRVRFSDCRANLFESNIYRTSIQFQQLNLPTNHLQTLMKSSGKPCEYLLEITNYFLNTSSIQTTELASIIAIYPFHNPWKKDLRTLGPCRTKVIPYREMIFTADIINISKYLSRQGQTVQIACPIEGAEKYLKYSWYYQRYQPKYQISNNRTIIFRNITEQMQGKYMCIGDDGYEKLEFEMTLHVTNDQTTNKMNILYFIIILTLIISICFLITILLYFSLKKPSQIISSIPKPNALTIHHNVMLTIQHLSQQRMAHSFLHPDLYETLDYIDDQPLSLSWIKQIPHRFSTRHRNVNRQLSMNIPLLHSHSDMTLSPTLKSNEKQCEMEMLKISVPLLNQYSLIKSSSSIISFDSQIELEEFNQMTSVCQDQ